MAEAITLGAVLSGLRQAREVLADRPDLAAVLAAAAEMLRGHARDP